MKQPIIRSSISLSVVSLCIIITIVSGLYMYPLPSGDAIGIVPAAWFYLHTDKFINPIYDIACLTDSSGLCRFCYHLPLFPLLISFIGRFTDGTVKSLFVIIAFISVVKIALFSYQSLTNRTLQRVWLATLLSVIYLTTNALPTVGRPEILSSLLILIIYVYLSKYSENTLHATIIIPFLMGILLWSHLIGYLLLLLTVSNLVWLRLWPIQRKIYTVIALVISSACIGCFLILLNPNGIAIIDGFLNHTALQLKRGDEASLHNFINYWLLSKSHFLFFAIFGVSICATWQYYIRKKINGLTTKYVLILFTTNTVILMFLIYSISIQTPARIYNITQFVPVILFINLEFIAKKQSAVRLAYVLLLVGSLTYSLRDAILFIDYLHDGKTYDKAVAQVNQRPGSVMIASPGLWVLSKDLRCFKVWTGESTVSPFFVQQARAPLPVGLIEVADLTNDWRTQDVRKILGVPLSNRPQGYSFSVWQYKKHP